MPTRDLGVLPNDVHRDPRAEASLIFVTLADGLDETIVKDWLTRLSALIDASEDHQGRDAAYASTVIAFGSRFFNRFPQYAANNPHGLTAPPTLPGEAEALSADVALHVTYTSEARLADLLKGLWATRPTVTSIDIEHGYARNDDREAFGHLDGLRNLTRDERRKTTTIDHDRLPEEPDWLAGGCYLAYLKIEQNLDAFHGLDQPTQEQIMGRRTDDGSRLDLAPGTDPKTEAEFGDPSNPPQTSHLRKTGPRGTLHDQTGIFRRGVPYVEEEGGVLKFGLQFVSYQATLDDFDVVLNRWMLNHNFPQTNTGRDALVERQLLIFKRAGLFVVVPDDNRHPGAGYFDTPKPPKTLKKGRVHVRKIAVDAFGNPTNAEVGGIQFTLHDQNGTQIGDPVTTNPAGHAVLPEVPVGTTVIIRETTPDRFQAVGDLTITIDQPNRIERITNTLKPDANPYG
ncbi:Dyp-type peroxidase [Nocardioides aurantiacus]|uniref:Dyp-type peroxidase family n=1 Tax=Nocardioides aurantiacus TaxID=86796 RepID=A0A3N2CU54_9ACTN|nr:Dyp-type peroxidase [Nocardioides aurantiacus]ROR90938.1 Dyp-type peroxidase family [Nocardioides aurantiacus]